MIIGLMGFECESPNKGCEALGYSFVGCLKRVIREKITFYVFTYDGLGYFPTYFAEDEFVRVPLKIKDVKLTTIRAMKKCDIIFDVTLGDSFSDIYSRNQCISNIKFKLLAEMFGKEYVLLPQTYGPFTDKKCLFWSKYIIQHADFVFCRDEKSRSFLNEIGISNPNIQLTTDMAFVLPFDSSQNRQSRETVRIGINVSGLLWKGGFESENQFGLNFDYQLFVTELLERFLSKKEVEVHLIAHVIDLQSDAHDDDYKCLLLLKEMYPEVVLAPIFKTPIEAKTYISLMDFFIGSRMHSTIASFSSGVSTVPVSYSRKFEGLFESLEYPYIIHGNFDNLDDAINNVLHWFDCREKLLDNINGQKEIIEKKLEVFLETIRVITDSSYKG